MEPIGRRHVEYSTHVSQLMMHISFLRDVCVKSGKGLDQVGPSWKLIIKRLQIGEELVERVQVEGCGGAIQLGEMWPRAIFDYFDFLHYHPNFQHLPSICAAKMDKETNCPLTVNIHTSNKYQYKMDKV